MMRTIEEIKADIQYASAYGTQKLLDAAWIEWFRYVAQGIKPDRLEEVCQAEQDERCVVLPCKVGDTLFDIFEFIENRESPEIYEYKADTIEFGIDKKGEFFVIDSMYFRPEDFGKTVFLTREEAEAALKEANNATN